MEKRGNWSSTFGFLMAAIGSAVGLGNMWGFPYKMGSNGGFAFLIIYLVLALLCGIVIMTIEMTIGRKTGKSPVLAMGQIGKRFKFVGWFGVLSAFIIMGFYTMIMGWVVRYVVDFFQAMIGIDVFAGMNGVEYFSSVYTDTTASFIYTFIAFALTSVIVMGGVSKGIERFSKIAIPALFGLLIVVIIKGLTMPGAGEGVKFMFTFDAENFNLFKTVRSAGGQMMFSLSLGMGILITYGSYMNKSENISRSAYIIPIADTIIAILSGLAIFPAVFALGMEPGGGVGLLFSTLHGVFNDMGAIGPFFGFLFYILVLIATVTSTVSLVEVVAAHFIDTRIDKGKPAKRKLVTGLCCLAMFVISIPVIFDKLGEGGMIKPLGMIWLDFYDFVSEGLMMPIGALVLCILVGWKLKMKFMDDEITLNGNKFVGRGFFAVCVKYVTPILFTFLIVSLILSYFGI
ncbi:MAG: sodium-dependent transporter [Christensenellaceae bacterium]|nr:sodium-dependent transporter [Christensenellaceae bacterium]